VLGVLFNNKYLIIFIFLIAWYIVKNKNTTVFKLFLFIVFLLYVYKVFELTGILGIVENLSNIKLSFDSIGFAFRNSQFIPFYFLIEGLKLNNNNFLLLLGSTYMRKSLYNLVMLIPFGILVPWLFKHRIEKVLSLTFTLVLFIESTQFFSNVFNISSRSFNVDDFILNILGSIIGYFIFRVILKNLLHTKLTK